MKYLCTKYYEKFCWFVVTKLPKRIQLFTFVLVYGYDGECPDRDYAEKYDYFVNKNKMRP